MREVSGPGDVRLNGLEIAIGFVALRATHRFPARFGSIVAIWKIARFGLFSLAVCIGGKAMSDTHRRFASDKEFVAHHRRLAAAGDEEAQHKLDTRSRIDLGQLFRESLGRGFAKTSEIFEPDSLVQK